MTTPITTTADRLMELAGRVPSSDWSADAGHVNIPLSEDFPGYDINLLPGHHRQTSLRLARFIAACDPQTITALCSAIKEMAAERDRAVAANEIRQKLVRELLWQRDSLKASAQALLVALRELADDTQHSHHDDCLDPDCPVKKAEAAIAAGAKLLEAGNG